MPSATQLPSSFWDGWSTLLCTVNPRTDAHSALANGMFLGMTRHKQRLQMCSCSLLALFHSGDSPWAEHIRAAANPRRKKKQTEQTPTQPHNLEQRPAWRRVTHELRERHLCRLWVWEAVCCTASVEQELPDTMSFNGCGFAIKWMIKE